MTMKKNERDDLIRRFSEHAREFNRRGDVVRRNQAEESIRELAPTRAYADRVISKLYPT
jgi:hypothetical protein